MLSDNSDIQTLFGAATVVVPNGDRSGQAGKYKQFVATQGSNYIGIILNYDNDDALENVDIHIAIGSDVESETGITDFDRASRIIANGF